MPIPFLKSKREKELEQKVSDLTGTLTELRTASRAKTKKLESKIADLTAENAEYVAGIEALSKSLEEIGESTEDLLAQAAGSDRYRGLISGIRVYRFGDVDVTYRDDDDFVAQVSEAPRVTVTAPKDVAVELLKEQHQMMKDFPVYATWMATRFPSVVAAQQEAGDG